MTNRDAGKPPLTLQGIGRPIKRRVDAMKNDVHLFGKDETLKKRKLLSRHHGNGIETRKYLLGDEGIEEMSRLMVRHDDRRAHPPGQPEQSGEKSRCVLAIEKVNYVDVEETAVPQQTQF